MIPSLREIAYGLYGAWRLLHFDRGGMAYFDVTVEGFWKSFFAAVLVAPGHVVLMAIHLADLEIAAGPLRLVLVEAITYVILWTAFPLVMHYLTQAIGRAPEYIGFIVAFNWFSVVQTLISVPVATLTVAGLLPAVVLPLVGILLLAYDWFITRTALDVSGLGATALVLLNLILVRFIFWMADSMIL